MLIADLEGAGRTLLVDDDRRRERARAGRRYILDGRARDGRPKHGDDMGCVAPAARSGIVAARARRSGGLHVCYAARPRGGARGRGDRRAREGPRHFVANARPEKHAEKLQLQLPQPNVKRSGQPRGTPSIMPRTRATRDHLRRAAGPAAAAPFCERRRRRGFAAALCSPPARVARPEAAASARCRR